MAELIYHPKAIAELREAAAFYESCREGLGRQFLGAVETAVGRIIQFPKLWRRISGEFRRILVRRFPYGIIYCLSNGVIYIIAVMHLKRKPGYWLSRLSNVGD